MNTCTKCKNPKEDSEFNKDRCRSNGLRAHCKECVRNHNKNNRQKINTREKLYRENNPDIINRIRERAKPKQQKRALRYSREHKEENQRYRQSPGNFDTFAKKIKVAEEVRRNPHNSTLLEVKCVYCDRWFMPSVQNIVNRYQSLEGIKQGENRLYCSDGCKQECPIYYRVKFPKGHGKQGTSREVQPQLRKIVLKRDNYMCQKCDSTENLHCHHIEGVEINPIESADVDNCITFCKKCHKHAHSQNGCKYHELRCT